MNGAPQLELDHVVVAAATLAEGVAWCEATLGIAPEAGGAHAFMGTHNRTLRVATDRFPQAYFEIIAIDPAAPAPPTPRWFGLDEPALQRALVAGPQLIQWVARVSNIEAQAAELRARGFDPGAVTAAERRTPHGLLRWQITIRADGRRLCDGALPTLIEWGEVHPSASLPASAVALTGATVGALPEPVAGWLGAALAKPGVAAPITIDRSAAAPLHLVFETPRGPVRLKSFRLEN